MSRTDKTAPYRVRAAYEGVARHEHARHDCDLPSREEQAQHVSGYSWLTGVHHCTYEVADSYFDLINSYFARSSAIKLYRAKDTGRLRGSERRAARAALKAARAGEELDDLEFGDGRHRHNALWEAY